MIASWMLRTIAVGLLFALAAAALERGAKGLRLARRVPWLAALAASLLWPVVIAGRAALFGPGDDSIARAILPALVIDGADRVGTLGARFVALLTGLSSDMALIVGWALASSVLLARGVTGYLAARRLRATATTRCVDGVDICVTEGAGPAVVGVRRPTILMPSWTLGLEGRLRDLVLRHEVEHRAARDPLLLLLASAAVALCPWNVALWLQARRLRLAIEIDCDARVLRAHPSATRYGLLLLTMAHYRTNQAVLAGPALTEPRSSLERRITAMRAAASRTSLIRVAGLLAAAVASIALACSVHAPDRVAGPKPASPTLTQGVGVYFEFQVEKPAAPRAGNRPPKYPDELRKAGVEGQVLAQFVVDTLGIPNVRSFKVLRSTDPQFTASVREALADFRFHPAEVGGRPVRQLVQMPFVFGISK